jgi:hypothetical protein
MSKDTGGLIFGQIFSELMNTDEPGADKKEKAASDAACGNFFSIRVSQIYWCRRFI